MFGEKNKQQTKLLMGYQDLKITRFVKKKLQSAKYVILALWHIS